MTWSLQIANGDFVVSQSEYSVVTDSNKLVQDLTCAIMEPMGTDQMHPSFGSIITGGTLPDGTISSGVIGLSGSSAAASINSEITRIAANYQAQQLNRAKSDRQNYNKVSLTPAEVLIALSNISYLQTQTTLQVGVNLQTAAGENINTVFPIPTS